MSGPIESKKKAKPKMVVAYLDLVINGDDAGAIEVRQCKHRKHFDICVVFPHGLVKESDLD